VKEVFEITHGIGADRSFECAGSDEAMAQCVYTLRKGGKTGFVSIPAVEMHPLPTKTIVMNQIAVLGSRANPNCSKEVLSLISSGKINVKDMITHTFALDDFATALETFVKRVDGAMKVVIHPNA
jgi:L-iditol 2-dehydrogenase